MIKRAYNYIKEARKHFFRYCVVGGSAFLLDIWSFSLLHNTVELPATVSVALNQVAIFFYVFFLNKHWSFSNSSAAKSQFAKFLALTVFNYIVSVVIMYLLHDIRGYDALTVRVMSIAVVVCWNFLLYKHWVYAKEIHSEQKEEENK